MKEGKNTGEDKHWPTAYREIKRQYKKGKPLSGLLKDAEAIADPYYSALGTFYLIIKGNMDPSSYAPLLEGTITKARSVKKNWRRAELLGKLCRMSQDLEGEGDRRTMIQVQKEILSVTDNIQKGKDLSDVLKSCARDVKGEAFGLLIDLALSNGDFSNNDVKTIIRYWASETGDKIPPEKMIEKILDSGRPFLASKSLGYMHLQFRKNNTAVNSNPFSRARDVLKSCSEAEKVEAIRYLIQISNNKNELRELENSLNIIDDEIERIRMNISIAGQYDRAGFTKEAIRRFYECRRLCEKIRESAERKKIVTCMINTAKGLVKCDDLKGAEKTYLTAVDLVKGHPMELLLINKIGSEMVKDNITVPKSISEVWNNSGKEMVKNSINKDPIKTRSTVHDSNSSIIDHGSNILGLFNTYKGKLGEVHYRSLGRAVPLCKGYGLELALIDFPAENVEELISKANNHSNIQGINYLSELFKTGKLHIVTSHAEIKGKGKMDIGKKNYMELGTPIATTPDPVKNKKKYLLNLLKKSIIDEVKEPFLVIIGLGRSGLPSRILNEAKYHCEITGRNVSLETCTAMGIIAYIMGQA